MTTGAQARYAPQPGMPAAWRIQSALPICGVPPEIRRGLAVALVTLRRGGRLAGAARPLVAVAFRLLPAGFLVVAMPVSWRVGGWRTSRVS